MVVFLRGVNVGGHRTFQPTLLAAQLQHLDAVNIGAAGTFLIRQPISQAQLRTELARRLPFDAGITLCRSSEIVKLVSRALLPGTQLGPTWCVSSASCHGGHGRCPRSR